MIYFTHSGFACLVMRRADQISTSRQPRFSHADQWKEGWASFYGNQLVFLSPLRLPVCNEHVLAHRMNFHQVKTEKHERSISSMVVSSLQWWSWITRRNVAPLSVESVPASHTSLMTVEARWCFCVRCKYSFSSEAGNKNAPKNIWRRLDADYTDGSNSTNAMS